MIEIIYRNSDYVVCIKPFGTLSEESENSNNMVSLLKSELRLIIYKDKMVLEGKISVPFCLVIPNTPVYRNSSALMTQKFCCYKTASHLKMKEICGFFGAEDEVRLTPFEDDKP